MRRPCKKRPWSVGARHRLALFPHPNLLPEGDPMGRPYKKRSSYLPCKICRTRSRVTEKILPTSSSVYA